MKLNAKQRLLATTHLEAADELTPKQKKIDLNNNGKIDGDDLKRLREGEEVEASDPLADLPDDFEDAPLTAAQKVTAAKKVDMQFKDGKTHTVSFFSDPGKYKGSFQLRSKGYKNLYFRKSPEGKYFVCHWKKGQPEAPKWEPTKKADAKEAYMFALKKYWKAV
jgi:hypothetical protein